MADKTAIEWTEATWNPITGCSVVSPGCTNCYAMKLAGTRLKHHPTRAGLTVETKAGPVWNGNLRFNERMLTDPLRWSRPRKIFVCAHGDLFHEDVPEEWIDRVFAVMALCPQHTFQVLTKRADRMRAYIKGHQSTIPYLGRMPLERVHLEATSHMEGDGGFMDALKERGNVYSLYCSVPWPLPNVWLGVSVEDQRRAEERIPDLLATPAALRWISAEPLLGPINLRRLRLTPEHHTIIDALDGYAVADDPLRGRERTMLDWVVAGGESGPHARPMHPQWVRILRDQCTATAVPFLFKQWGSWEPRDAWSPGTIQQIAIMRNGNQVPHDVAPQDVGGQRFVHVGKTAAGRRLDGELHDAFPQVQP